MYVDWKKKHECAIRTIEIVKRGNNTLEMEIKLFRFIVSIKTKQGITFNDDSKS